MWCVVKICKGDSQKRDGNHGCMISVLISSFLFNVGCYRVEIKGARKKMDVFINLICIGRIDIVVFLGI